MATAEKLNALRLIIGGQNQVSDKEFWTAPELPSGVPRGVIVELLGPYKTEWTVQFLAMHSTLKTFWAEKERSVLPTALKQRGVDLGQVKFGTFAADMVQPLRRIIQSQCFDVILAPNAFEEMRIFQAFQLFTEKSNSTLFLFGNKTPSPAWPISLQLEIHKGSTTSFEIEILKQKHGK